MSTNTRETSADILRNRTPVRRRNKQMLPVEFENAHVVRTAEASRTPDHDLQHGLEFARRRTDDLKDLGCRPLLFQRLVALAGEACNLCFLAGDRGATSAYGLWRTAPLWRHRFVALRFGRFAACSGASAHRLPQGSGQGIVAS